MQIHNRHTCHNIGHSIMYIIHLGEYWAELNKQMARWNASVHSMQNTVASVITESTSKDVDKKHIYCISVQLKIDKTIVISLHVTFVWITHPVN